VQSELLPYPGEQIGQREQRGCVGAVSKGQGVGAGEGLQKEGVLGEVARDVSRAKEPSPRRHTNGCVSASDAKSLFSDHN
jgi:hypothetical protein